MPSLRLLEHVGFTPAPEHEREGRSGYLLHRVPSSRLLSFLFPCRPRDFRGRRAVKIVLRALHVLAAGVLTGAYVLGLPPEQSAAWLHGTALSGVVLLLFDLHQSAIFLLQLRGLFVLLKIACLVALPLFVGAQGLLLALLLVLSVISSHAPARVRYAVCLWRGRFAPSRSKG